MSSGIDPHDPVRALRVATGKAVRRRVVRKDARTGDQTPTEQPRPPSDQPVTLHLHEIVPKGRARTHQTTSAFQAICVALRLRGCTYKEIAQHLHVTDELARRAVIDAQASAPVQDVDLILNQRAVREAVEGLVELLEARDKDAIFKTLDGLGKFKHHSVQRGSAEVATAMTLHVQFGVPPGLRDAVPLAALATGRPREDETLDAEIVADAPNGTGQPPE